MAADGRKHGRVSRRQLVRGALVGTAAGAVGVPLLAGAKTEGARVESAAPGHSLKPESTVHPLQPVDIRQVTIDDPFWSPRLRTWREVTLSDCFTKFENDRGGALNNFDLVREGKTGKHAGPEWYDGLIYEMITAAADFLAARRDPALEARLHGYLQRIEAAQARDPRGYLNTWTQTMAPQSHRWGLHGGDDRSQHDIYNAGMLIEAGVHHYRATGELGLLAAGTRIANLMCDTFGPSPRANAVPGHSGPEFALVQLANLFHEVPNAIRVPAPAQPDRYLELAQFFIDQRGHYEGRTGKDRSYGEYGQDQAPLAQQATLEGHAVRATLFCTGITALARATGRADYRAAALRFWDSFARHKMYLTGAAGAIGADEKFGPDDFLPNDGYMETCAAVGAGLFHHEMNLLFGEARYVDELERALYNGVLGGVGQAGNCYYYQDPLQGDGLRRWDWHECPCCPPMFLKLTGALPGLIYAQESDAIYVNLFVGSRATLHAGGTEVRIRQTTRYPWDGKIRLEIDPARAAELDLFVRIPAWCQGPTGENDLYRVDHLPREGAAILRVNGRDAGKLEMVRGYARLHRRWERGDVVELSLEMPVRQVRAHPRVAADAGRVALTRGPIVYCLESVDNPELLASLVVPPDAKFTTRFEPQLLGGVVTLRGRVPASAESGGRRKTTHADLTAIPFYASANREPGAMRVWLAASEERAIPSSLATRSHPTASHCWHLDSVAAINDGALPPSSRDITQRRLSWWDHRGTTEWAALTFPQAEKVSRVRLYWFADRPGGGGCDLPQNWRLLYRDGDNWKPVEPAGEYGIAADRFNEVAFAPVRTTALRVEVQLRPGWSSGICEWQVE